MYTVQMVQTTHYSLKAESLKMALTVGMVDRVYIPRTGEGVRSLRLPGSSSRVNQGSSPLNDSSNNYLTYCIFNSRFIDCPPPTAMLDP